ncbi:MAG: NADH-ubiquinone oxidoreductase-F iron-sulfur binding region domain-containing protein, partial [Acidimicrobiales bacterium]
TTCSRGPIVAAVSGVANPVIPAALLDTPLTYEDMSGIGSGLGAGGFIVLDDESDLVAFAQGVSRFLAVESCGQCTPCKQDGVAIADLLDRIRSSEADPADLDEVQDRLDTVANSSRCYLATQQEQVVRSVLSLFPEPFVAHLERRADAADVFLVAQIKDIVDGQAILDERQAAKQPDWRYDEEYSGQSPADHIDQRTPAGPASDETAV